MNEILNELDDNLMIIHLLPQAFQLLNHSIDSSKYTQLLMVVKALQILMIFSEPCFIAYCGL